MDDKHFRKNDSGFICQNCGAEVPPLGYTSRNHCPYCLCSLHVDIMPGDRANPCGGIMDAVSARPDKKQSYILIHRCRKCGEIRNNKAAYGEDDIGKILLLTACQP